MFLFLELQPVGIYSSRFSCSKGFSASLPVILDVIPAGSPSTSSSMKQRSCRSILCVSALIFLMVMTIFSLRFVSGNMPVFRSTGGTRSPDLKRQRIHLMAERCVSGKFGGSAWHATKSPTTARMSISIGAIQRQYRPSGPRRPPG